jgi:hypothetical protein
MVEQSENELISLPQGSRIDDVVHLEPFRMLRVIRRGVASRSS